MEHRQTHTPLSYVQVDPDRTADELGKEGLKTLLHQMVLIRQFEIRAEAAYQQGKIGGFLHLYIGQEALQTGAVRALGKQHWYSTSYRCHALALLLGESPRSLMAELFGRATGNARGRGGSMHMYSKRMLGGFGIVSGHLPIATGAAFTCKYLAKKDEISVCFFGDGACAQGVFHESLNLASMWSLPCLYVVENNRWSMGTPLSRTLTNPDRFLQSAAEAYDIRYFRIDGMDLLQTYGGFSEAYRHMTATGRPVLVECMIERFKGHSISDPGLYRTKGDLALCMSQDPIPRLLHRMIAKDWISQTEYDAIEQSCYEEVAAAATAADQEPWPNPSELEEGVYASH